MDSREESRFDTAALIAIVIVGMSVRLWFLSRPLQLDEAYTYNEYASKPVLDGISWYTLPNNHLLNTLLVHASTATLGDERWAVRLPAFLAGVLLIPATFCMASRLCGRPQAPLAAALVAASEPLIDYSTNARGYTPVALITVLLVVLGLRIRESGGRAWDWVGFTILPALGFFAIPIMLYPYGGIVLWLMLTSRGRGPGGRRSGLRLDRLVVSGIGTALLSVMLYIPALVRKGIGAVAGNVYVSPRPLGDVLHALPGSLGSAWLQWNRDVPRPVAALFLLAWAASLARFLVARRGCLAPTTLIVTVLGWSVSIALVQRVVPYDRVWLFAAPLYAACVAEGLSGALEGLGADSVPGRRATLRPGLAVLLCLGLSAIVARGDALGPKHWGTLHHADTIARLLKPILRSDDGVVALTPGDAPLKYEFLRHRIPVEHLYDYRIHRARRLYVAINRPGQDVADALAQFNVSTTGYSTPRLIRDFGTSALYELERR